MVFNVQIIMSRDQCKHELQKSEGSEFHSHLFNVKQL